MSIYKKVRAVERVFTALDQEIGLFQKESGLHCLASCGKCCTKPDIEASVLEFLPFAYHLYKQNQAFSYLQKLAAHAGPLCILLQPFLGQQDKGFCSQYLYRGLICRLFGFSGRKNKHGQKEVVTCHIIKTEQPEAFEHANQEVQTGNTHIPIMSNYSMMLYTIDPQLAGKYYPINEAIRLAIETVLSYYSYRSKRAG